MSRARFFLLALVTAGCARSIAPDGSDSGVASQVAAGDAIIDASSETDWTYLDLGNAEIVTPANPDDSTEWDLAFRRYKVKINGGVSGTADMAVVPYFETEYNTPLDPPTEGWVTDEADADADGDPEYALDTWFDYDSSTHEVTPADVIYVVRDAQGDLAKLQFLAYYDDAGTPGYIHIRWGPLSDEQQTDTGETGDTGERGCSTDSSKLTSTDLGDGVTLTQAYTGSEDEYVCFSFATAGMVTKGWDLAWLKWDIQGGPTEIAILPKQDFDALTQAPAKGYRTDSDEKGLVLQDWYIYNTEVHTLDPRDEVYVMHTAADQYYKMKILSYYPDGDTEQPHYPSWKWAEIAAP